jgi:chitodextrinase
MPTGAVVYGVGNDWDAATARSTCTGQSLAHQYLSSTGDTFWTQRVDSATAGTVAVCDTAPTADRYNLVGVVVAPASPDTTAPTAPTGVTASNLTSSTADLSWTASTDNIGVTGYDIHSGGSIIASTAATHTTISGLAPSTTYSLTVTAHDAAGNTSTASTPVGVTTPAQTTNCIPAQADTQTNTVSHLCGFPDTTNTGVPAGTTLTNSGDVVVSTPGAVIQNLNVTGSIHVTASASNVTIKNTYINYSGNTFGILGDGDNLHIQDVTIVGTSASAACIGWGSYTATRVNCSGAADGFKAQGNGTTITDSYTHDLAVSGVNHSDGVQDDGSGQSGITISHNTFLDYNGNSCIRFGVESGNSSSNVSIDDNLFDGGGYIVEMFGTGTDLSFTNNHIGRGSQFGTYYQSSNPNPPVAMYTTSGNVWDDDGTPNN